MNKYDLISERIFFIFKVCLYFHAFKMTVSAILLAMYVRQSDHQGTGGNQAIEIYNLILLIGCKDRGLKFAGVLACGFFIAQISIYFSVRYIHEATRVATNKTGLKMFIQSPDLEQEQLSRRIDSHIRKVLASNFAHATLHRSQLTSGSQVHGVGGWETSYTHSKHTPRRPMLFANEVPRSPNGFDETRKYPRELIEQRKYLNQLRIDNSPVWPVNRTKESHDRMIKVYCYSYILSAITFSITGICATALTAYLAYTALRDNQTLRPELRSFNLMERIDLVWEHLFMWRISEWYTESVSFVICGYIDQKRNFDDLQMLLLDFNRMLLQLNENKAQNFNNEDDHHDDHLPIYDIEALKLYIKFKIYINEARLMFRRAEYCVLFSYGGLGYCVLLASSLDGQMVNSRLFNYLTISCVLILNIALYPCALLTQNCIKVTKLTWSLVANVELSGQSYHLLQMDSSADSSQWTPALYDSRPEPLQIKLKHKRQGQRVISANTLLLWRRIIEDSESLLNLLSCNLFGIVHLNFATVFKFNFYVASVVMLLLNH